MSDSMMKALRVFHEFQTSCGERAKYAVLHPLVRDSRGRNLRQAFEESGLNFRESIDELAAKGLLKTHGWRGRNGATGIVISLTDAGREAISSKGAKGAKGPKGAKGTNVEPKDAIQMLLKALEALKEGK